MNSALKCYRCAIYTRKSHEEGVEQEFNTLDAQREAGEAYIQSQKNQNWSLLKRRYDDGGFSGGSVERPALRKLLSDIQQSKVDIVVVYKVDRLSRSLGDFAKLMDIFDEHQVSFVSVTQQFNTTSSMGRLTLNMLLSFAQFEREVTGERLKLLSLSPKILQQITSKKLSPLISLKNLYQAAEHLDWEKQHKFLGI